MQTNSSPAVTSLSETSLRIYQQETFRQAPRGLLVLNGDSLSLPLLDNLWKNAALKVATDGAFKQLKSFNYSPDVVLGDFDSSFPHPRVYSFWQNCIINPLKRAFRPKSAPALPKFLYRPDQNFTDSEKALDYFASEQIRQVDCINFLGERLDHSFHHFLLLHKADTKGLELFLHSQEGVAFFVKQPFLLKGFKGKNFSFFGLPEASVKKTSGLRYRFFEKNLDCLHFFSISNQISQNEAYVELTSGSGWVFLEKMT